VEAIRQEAEKRRIEEGKKVLSVLNVAVSCPETRSGMVLDLACQGRCAEAVFACFGLVVNLKDLSVKPPTADSPWPLF